MAGVAERPSDFNILVCYWAGPAGLDKALGVLIEVPGVPRLGFLLKRETHWPDHPNWVKKHFLKLLSSFSLQLAFCICGNWFPGPPVDQHLWML